MSSADWTTFNSKQNALTNPVTGTGASGQVAYFTGTTAITSEANLFWDATNDRLGVGTATPLSKLHVVNNGGVPSTNLISSFANEGANLEINITSAATGSAFIDLLARSGGGGNVSSAGFTFSTRNAGTIAEQMRITSAGNVGIGTNAPAFANGSGLEIERAGISTLRIQNTTGSNSFELYVDSAANGITFYGANSSSFIFSPAATERWRITTTGIFQSNGAQTIQSSTGNLTLATAGGNGNIVLSPNGTGGVGIGTTDVEETLTVARVGGGDGTIAGFRSDATFSQFKIETKESQTSFGLNAVGGRNIYFTTNSTERWRITSVGIFQSNGLQTIQTSTGNLTLATAAGNGHIVLSPHGTGNVGIGTATPANRLQVGADSNVSRAPGEAVSAFSSSTGTETVVSFGQGSTNGNTGVTLSFNPNRGGIAANSGWYQRVDGATANGFMSFGQLVRGTPVTLTEHIRISSGGNLAIGTINATGQSADNRVIQIYGAGTVNRAQIHFVNVNTGETATDGSFIGIDSSSELFIINRENAATVFENNGTQTLRITADGVIGFNGSSVVANASLDKMSMGYLNSNYGWIQTWNSTPLVLNGSGNNVLIGTTTNGASKLRIVGLPTSAVGLSSGDVYNLAGTLMIA